MAGPLILHGNAHLHIAYVITKKLRDYGWEALPHAAYSLNMSPPDFDLFPKLKKTMSGRFSSLEELSTDITRVIQHMNKSGILDGIICFPNIETQLLRSGETILKDCAQIISKK